MMAEVLVKARNLGHTYTRGPSPVAALVRATCTVHAGDLVALVGRSGSGKSTLLHLLGGLETPTAGSIEWPALGKRVGLRPSQIAFVFQSASLIPALTVLENIQLPLLLGGTAPNSRATALAALDLLQITGLAGKLPEELSGGQAQRVAIARALAVRPRLVLADEPTGQLDQATAAFVMSVLLDALQSTGAALVVATHDPAVAVRMSERWAIRQGILKVNPHVVMA